MKQRSILSFYLQAFVAAGATTAISVCAQPLPAGSQKEADRPNVLLIAIDDLNDYIAPLNRSGLVAHTPNIERLMARGTLFSNAQCAAPICNPSRTAMLTGISPHRSGIYNNRQPWNAFISFEQTFPVVAKRNGYKTAGAGKIMHHLAGFQPRQLWDVMLPFDDRAQEGIVPKLTGIDGLSSAAFDWGIAREGMEDMPDTKITRWATDYLQENHDRPFLLAVGLYRPHLPWYAPKEFFDLYPLESISLPPEDADELADLPPRGIEIARIRVKDTKLIDAAGKRKEAIRAYLACISYTDALVGRLLDALDSSPSAKNTMVVLVSDHGFHLGEKQHWHKFTLWAQSTRSLMIIAPPDQSKPGRTSVTAVSLLDIAPTLADYCKWQDLPAWDGSTIRPFVENPNKQDPDRFVLTSYTASDHAVTTRDWRYIYYGEGQDELYNQISDPLERHNLASDPEFREIRSRLRSHIPANAAAGRPASTSFKYSEESGRWIPVDAAPKR
jgi:arylsulfatase A-like enzyme